MSDATWESGLCGCCDVKDCGIGCCCKLYCGGPCVFGSAMEKAGLGSCAGCCCALACFPVCTLCNARVEVAKKYGIKEGGMGACVQSCCCPSCTAIQIINQVPPMPAHYLSWPPALRALHRSFHPRGPPFSHNSSAPAPGPTRHTHAKAISSPPRGRSRRFPDSFPDPCQGERDLGLLRRGGERRSPREPGDEPLSKPGKAIGESLDFPACAFWGACMHSSGPGSPRTAAPAVDG